MDGMAKEETPATVLGPRGPRLQPELLGNHEKKGTGTGSHISKQH